MNGSALYKGVTAVFILQVYGLPFGIEELMIILVTATAAAVAGVGIPGSSLVTTLIVLNALGLGPQAAAGIALVVGLDRILDMFRTAVNVTGDLTCAAYIARVEGELIHPHPWTPPVPRHTIR
jgi:Na+/H+-dicarboxylate symporter